MIGTNKKIRVVSLINNLAPAGAEKVLLQIADNIDKNKFDLSVCCLEKDVTLAKDFEAAGARVFSLGIAGKYDITVLWKLYRFLKKGDFDILHTHLSYANILGRIIGRAAGVPAIVSAHHNDRGHLKPILRFLESLTLPLADLVTCVSEEAERSFFGSYNEFSPSALAQKIKHLTIYNGIDLKKVEDVQSGIDPSAKRKELGIGRADPIILNVARLIPLKGHADLISAFGKVVKAMPDAKLIIAGWGELDGKLKKQTAGLGLEKNILFLGRRDDIYEILKIADVFCLPYNFKEFPGGWMSIAIMEAMAASKPIVITSVPGVERAVIDNKTGLVVPMGDAAALAGALLKLLRDPVLAREMGTSSHALAEEKFSIEKVVKQYEELYGYCLKNP